jgi:phage tail-like protein
MRDVNGSSFQLLADASDWASDPGSIGWSGGACLAGKQHWLLPPDQGAAKGQQALAASSPLVVDSYGGQARLTADRMSVETLDGANWTPMLDNAGAPLAPKAGKFIDMALGGARLALLASDGAQSYLHLFDLRARWGLATPQNPPLAVKLDAQGPGVVAVAPDGPVFVAEAAGIGFFKGGPVDEFIAPPTNIFTPVDPNPDPLRRAALLNGSPSGAVIAMAADETRLVLLQQGTSGQKLAQFDRATNAWSSAPLTATDATPLPFMIDVALLPDGLIALMALAHDPTKPLDSAVGTLVAGTGFALAARRYPMLDQAIPRFAAVGGARALYLGSAGPRPLLPLPYPAYVAEGALWRLRLASGDPDLVWSRIMVEAEIPPGCSIEFWARTWNPGPDAADPVKAETALQTTVQTALAATPDLLQIGAGDGGPDFHRQPPLVANSLPSELPFHPGLAALAGGSGGLYETLLQRRNGRNRRMAGAFLDLIAVLRGDGLHSPLLRCTRVYAPRFCYQQNYLPSLFQQTSAPDDREKAGTLPSPADFRERFFANLEGLLTPLENRVAVAEYLLDPYAAPVSALPWLASYLGVTLKSGWPEARMRRAIAEAGRLMRWRGSYRGVCLALDIVSDGAVARGEIVVLETHRLRRADATLLGLNLSDSNPLTGYGVLDGNSIVGDTLVLAPERIADLVDLLAPAALRFDPAQVARFLDQYIDRYQVTVLMQGSSAGALETEVRETLDAEMPAQIAYDLVRTDGRFILGLSPLLDIDTFLDPAAPSASLTLNQSVTGRDSVVRNPAALRQ